MRIFLDANVLFSAAYLQDSELRRLWRLKGVELLSSSYAVEEARRNLSEDRPEALASLDGLVKSMKLVEEAQDPRIFRILFESTPRTSRSCLRLLGAARAIC